MPKPWMYNLLYRFGAPWEIGPRQELVELVESGRLSPERLAPGRAIDLGCGSGANSLYLAEHGFEVTGVDFSTTALAKATRAAKERGLGDRVRFVRGDLTETAIPGAEGPFDLLVDYGTLDDVRGEARRAMAATVVRLARPGSVFLMWCFYARASELPVISFSGPSKLAPAIAPGEERGLFGEAFDIERLPNPPEGSRTACFVMTRR
jgi:SAM-dependent methyltransferase